MQTLKVQGQESGRPEFLYSNTSLELFGTEKSATFLCVFSSFVVS